MKQYYTYILTNWNDQVMYVGVTGDLKRRMYEHKNHLIDGFTKTYNVTKLVYYEIYTNPNDSIAREKQIKGWKREKKNFLVARKNPEYKELEI
ncbi:MAG: GIY-YIG nuclease family protein [Clostridia bacterium]|nr:GIY-YIG nuclease family protein [Clostridia bacterium]